MIGLKELCALIDGLGIPWANQRFENDEEPAPPFIVLVAGFSSSAAADNICWRSWMEYDVALYTRFRDYATEKAIADALTAADVMFEKTITQLDSENLIEAAFTVNVAEYED